MGIDSLEDLKRKNNEMCLLACRKRLSAQTGFIHFCYEAKYEKAHDSIPYKENLSYVLALLKSKQQENVQLAKELLVKLLAFEKEGLLPTYIHEFPKAARSSYRLQVCIFLHYIMRDFTSIMGGELKKKVEEVLERVLKGLEKDNLSITQKLLLNILKKEEVIEITKTSFNSEEALEILIAYQLEKNGYTESLLKLVLKNYHKELSVYAGSNVIYYEKSEIEKSLSDLYFCEIIQHFPKRLTFDHPVNMLASLIYPFEAIPDILFFQSKKSGSRQLSLFWGSSDKVYSLLIEAKNTELKWQKLGQLIKISIPLSLLEVTELSEVQCFLSDFADVSVFVEGKKSTLFMIGDRLNLETENGKLELCFESLDKDSGYVGHLLKGNRPTQKCVKGEFLFKAHDYIIGVRSLEKSASSMIQITLDLSSLATWLVV